MPQKNNIRVDGIGDITELTKVILEHLDTPPYKNYSLSSHSDHLIFRFQPAGVKPFGNNAQALRIDYNTIDENSLELSIKEQHDWMVPLMVGALMLIALFYGIANQRFVLTVGIWVFGGFLLYYNSIQNFNVSINCLGREKRSRSII